MSDLIKIFLSLSPSLILSLSLSLSCSRVDQLERWGASLVMPVFDLRFDHCLTSDLTTV